MFRGAARLQSHRYAPTRVYTSGYRKTSDFSLNLSDFLWLGLFLFRSVGEEELSVRGSYDHPDLGLREEELASPAPIAVLGRGLQLPCLLRGHLQRFQPVQSGVDGLLGGDMLGERRRRELLAYFFQGARVRVPVKDTYEVPRSVSELYLPYPNFSPIPCDDRKGSGGEEQAGGLRDQIEACRLRELRDLLRRIAPMELAFRCCLLMPCPQRHENQAGKEDENRHMGSLNVETVLG